MSEKGERRSLYPDFRLSMRKDEDDQNSYVVLDAKYKFGDALNGINVRRADMHQCLAYMFLTGAKVGGVIYPPNLDGTKTDDEKDDEKEGFWKVKAPDSERFWKSFTFRKWDSNKNFNEEMKTIESEFKEYLHKVIDKAKT